MLTKQLTSPLADTVNSAKTATAAAGVVRPPATPTPAVKPPVTGTQPTPGTYTVQTPPTPPKPVVPTAPTVPMIQPPAPQAPNISVGTQPLAQQPRSYAGVPTGMTPTPAPAPTPTPAQPITQTAGLPPAPSVRPPAPGAPMVQSPAPAPAPAPAPRPAQPPAPMIQAPATPRPPVNQAPAGAEIHTINPAADLRSTQISPADSGRTAVTKGFTNQAAAGVANAPSVSQDAATLRAGLFKELNPTDLKGGAAINPTLDARTIAAQGNQDAAARAVAGGIQQGTAAQIADSRYGTLAQQLKPGTLNAVQGPSSIAARVGPSGLQALSGGTDVEAQKGLGNLTAINDASRLNPILGGTDIQAMSGPNSIKGGAAVDPTQVSARLAANTSLADRAAAAVGNGASRTDIAKQQLQAYDLEHANDLRENTQKVGQAAARFGRLGQGATEQAVTQTLADMERQRRAEELRLAAETASGDITDRLNNLNSLQGYQGQNFSQDQSVRGEQRAERDYSTGLESQNVGMQREDARNAQSVAESNLGRQRENAAIQTGAQATNIGYNRADAANTQAVQQQNIGYSREDAANLQAQLNANLERRRQDALNQQGVAAQNIGWGREDAANQQNVDLTNVGMQREDAANRQSVQARNLDADQAARSQAVGLAAQQGQQAVSDRFSALDAFGGQQGQAFAQNQAMQDAQRGERAYQDQWAQYNQANDIRAQEYAAAMGQSLAGANAGQRFQTLDAAQGLEGQQVAQDAGVRNELRGERGYQADAAQNALNNRTNQALLEDQLTGSQHARNLQDAEFGYSGNPAALTAQIGQDYSTDANQSFATAADLMKQQQLQQYLASLGRAA